MNKKQRESNIRVMREAMKRAKMSSELAAGAMSSVYAGAEVGRRSSPMAGELNGHFRVTVLQINPQKKGKLKVPPSVILKVELVSSKAPYEVMVELGEKLCHQGYTVSVVGPTLSIPFKLEIVPK